jgi:hypothetical protein
MLKRIIALSVIFVCTWIAWGILSVVINMRTDETTGKVSGDVSSLWGGVHEQNAPTVQLTWTTEEVVAMTDEEKELQVIKLRSRWENDPRNMNRAFFPPDTSDWTKRVETRHTKDISTSSNTIEADLEVEQRKRGLLWFATYRVDFRSAYHIENPEDMAVWATVTFQFPSARAVYDNMALEAWNDEKASEPAADFRVTTEGGKMIGQMLLPPKASRYMQFKYQSRGLDSWQYRFGPNIEVVQQLDMTIRTNFDNVDFPMGSISPDENQQRTDGTGRVLRWKKESLVSDLNVGMLMPHNLNPGPLAMSMTLHAPVSLFFFMFMMFMIQVLRDLRFHPMNYFFIAASFFAFNLLFSYLVSHLPVGVAFVASSAVSLALVITYLRRFVGTRFALVEAGISQFMFQVLFSLAHFLEGYTGLTITIGAIITLAVAMHLTAKLDWEAVFRNNTAKKTA